MREWLATYLQIYSLCTHNIHTYNICIAASNHNLHLFGVFEKYFLLARKLISSLVSRATLNQILARSQKPHAN